MPRNFVLGLDAKVYVLGPIPSTGTRPPQPTDYDTDLANLIEVCEVQDVTLNMSSALADTTTRCAGGFRTQVATLKDANPSTTFLWQPDNNTFNMFLDAWLNNWTVGLALMDGPKDFAGLASGDQITGLYGEFSIADFTRNEPLEEALTANVEFQLAPSASSVLPQWVIRTAP